MEERLREKLGPDFYLKKEYDLGLSELKSPVDLMVKRQKRIYLIEYEIHRADPSNNVAKIAYWLYKEKPKEDVTVIQVLTPHYLNVSGKKNAKAVLAVFLGKQLIKKLHRKRYSSIYSKIFTKNEFEELYKSFPKNQTHSPEVEDKIERFVEDIVEQVSNIIL